MGEGTERRAVNGDVGDVGLPVDTVTVATSIKADGQVKKINLLATYLHDKLRYNCDFCG